MSGQGSGPKQAWLVWMQVDAEHVKPGSSELAGEQQVGQDRPALAVVHEGEPYWEVLWTWALRTGSTLSWLANNSPSHTHRTSTDPEYTQREDELLLSTFHSSECEPQRELQTAPGGLGHQNYVLLLLSRKNSRGTPVATETAKDNSSPVIWLGTRRDTDLPMRSRTKI